MDRPDLQMQRVVIEGEKIEADHQNA